MVLSHVFNLAKITVHCLLVGCTVYRVSNALAYSGHLKVGMRTVSQKNPGTGLDTPSTHHTPDATQNQVKVIGRTLPLRQVAEPLITGKKTAIPW